MTDFGITPEMIDQIVARWRSSGQELIGMSLSGIPEWAGCATLEGLSRCAVSATTSTCQLGDELLAVSEALSRFNALTVESDEAAAADIAGLSQ